MRSVHANAMKFVGSPQCLTPFPILCHFVRERSNVFHGSWFELRCRALHQQPSVTIHRDAEEALAETA